MFVYVDGRSRRSVRHELDRLRDEFGFVVLRADRRLTPNQARTIGLREVTTPYVVFVDNDCLVQPGWLTTLLRTAEEQNATVVGPLYATGDPVPQRVHVAGGFTILDGAAGERHFQDILRFYNLPWVDLPTDLQRQRCDFAEFHCLLIRTDILVAVGGLDEAMFSTHEHLDLCMRVSAAGGEVWFEPAVVVNFAFPSELRVSDLPYFLWRWSEQATRATLEHFSTKYDIGPEFLERHVRDRVLVTSGLALRTAPSSHRTQIRQPRSTKPCSRSCAKRRDPSNDPSTAASSTRHSPTHRSPSPARGQRGRVESATPARHNVVSRGLLFRCFLPSSPSWVP